MTNTLTTQSRALARIAAIRAVMDGATKGKWVQGTKSAMEKTFNPDRIYAVSDENGAIEICSVSGVQIHAILEEIQNKHTPGMANARFIALAHNIMPAMLKAIEFQVGLLNEMEMDDAPISRFATKVRVGLKEFLAATDWLFPEEGKG